MSEAKDAHGRRSGQRPVVLRNSARESGARASKCSRTLRHRASSATVIRENNRLARPAKLQIGASMGCCGAHPSPQTRWLMCIVLVAFRIRRVDAAQQVRSRRLLCDRKLDLALTSRRRERSAFAAARRRPALARERVADFGDRGAARGRRRGSDSTRRAASTRQSPRPCVDRARRSRARRRCRCFRSPTAPA